ncbi:MAG: beta-ketoacyl-[acyl-carrier-protein] synthase family protein, partial [Candidatus Eisenbacteria sp.]|nr:beta-ketoacyl-[acyl-carrier-protein] synthase family protein [Candidatus Eisenbacteria bacterium]
RLARSGALGRCGPVLTLSLSCASGNAAVASAADLLRSGRAEMALAAGYDAMSDLSWGGLCALRTMSEDKVRPFDRRRDGTIFSEGCGAIVLETLEHARKRGADVLAEVTGYATNNNAYHMTHPPKDGQGMTEAMRAALCNAGLAPESVDYINAHGTGTKLNDSSETAAIKAVFGEHAYRMPVTSNKSMVGHAMGAASALEAVASVLTLRDGIIPPTINLEEPDPECDLDYVPNESRKQQVQVVLNNASGIGGCNCAVIFRRLGESRSRETEKE